VNGVAQAGASFVRFVGPTLGGGLYSYSLTYHEALGEWHLHVAYLVVALTAALTFCTSFWLPRWAEVTEDDAIEADAKARAASAAADAAARGGGGVGNGGGDGGAGSDDDEELERELSEAAAAVFAHAHASERAPARPRLATGAAAAAAADASDDEAFAEFGGGREGARLARAPR